MAVITEEYRAEQAHLHATNDKYGVASLQYGGVVTAMCQDWHCDTVLDYGAGKQRLKQALDEAGFEGMYIPYDPALPEIASIPPAEYPFVACIDVLEHIEPDCLDDVLDDLQKHVHFRGFFTVHTGPAIKILRDGRNAHLTQQPYDWWLPKFQSRFNVIGEIINPQGFQVLVEKQKCPKHTSNGGKKQ